MNIQDNGPRDGDFVRYIAELNAKSALAAKTTPTPTAATMPATTRSMSPPTVVVRPGPTQNQTSQAGQLVLPSWAGTNAITTAAIVAGGIAIAIGALVPSLFILFIVGIASMMWGMRRVTGARKTKA